MKFTLEGCKHRRTASSSRNDAVETCLACYERLILEDIDGHPFFRLVPAPPPPVCSHPKRLPVSVSLTANRDYTDAMCRVCGVVQRHPDGPGAWEDVLFYGYRILEEP